MSEFTKKANAAHARLNAPEAILRVARIKPVKAAAKMRLMIIEVEGDDQTLRAAVEQLQSFYKGIPAKSQTQRREGAEKMSEQKPAKETKKPCVGSRKNHSWLNGVCEWCGKSKSR